MTNITQKIIKILEEISSETVTEDTQLIKDFIISSYELLEVVFQIQGEFSIEIDKTQITIENFSTVKGIVKLVQSYHPEG